MGAVILFTLIAYGAYHLYGLANKSDEVIAGRILKEIRVVQNVEELINLGDQLVHSHDRNDWWDAGLSIQALSYHPAIETVPLTREIVQVTYQVASTIMRQRDHEIELRLLDKTELAEKIRDGYIQKWEEQKVQLQAAVDELTVALVGEVGAFSYEINSVAEGIVHLSIGGAVVVLLVIVLLYVAGQRYVLKPLRHLSKNLEELQRDSDVKIDLPMAHSQEIQDVFKAVQELSSMRKALEKMALYDRLSGLGNRNLFDELLPRWIANAIRNQQKLAVFFMDLDGFKEINDEFGHDTGNTVLHIIGMRLADFSRTNDLYFRIGGDEFAAILYVGEDYQADGEKIAQRIIRLVEEPIPHGAGHLHVSISIGMAFYPVDSTNNQELITLADRNMYSAKRHHLGYVPCHDKSEGRGDNVITFLHNDT